jgi:hypothetical protein
MRFRPRASLRMSGPMKATRAVVRNTSPPSSGKLEMDGAFELRLDPADGKEAAHSEQHEVARLALDRARQTLDLVARKSTPIAVHVQAAEG